MTEDKAALHEVSPVAAIDPAALLTLAGFVEKRLADDEL
jgi:hypothetical protein